MPIPVFEHYLLPALTRYGGGDIHISEIRDYLSEHFPLSNEDLQIRTQGGTDTKH